MKFLGFALALALGGACWFAGCAALGAVRVLFFASCGVVVLVAYAVAVAIATGRWPWE